MGKTTYQANNDLKRFFGKQAVTVPDTLYLALSVNSTVSESSFTEPNGGGYARVAIQNNTTNFPTPTNRSVSLAVAVSFPESTASWGVVYGAALFDAATNGNMLYVAELATPKTVDSETTITFPANSITFTES